MNKITKNPAAVALGKLGAGKPKHYSKEELAKRTARLPKRLKNLIVLALGALALAGNVLPVRAGSLYGDFYNEGKLRRTSEGRFYRSNQEDLDDARRDALDQACLNTERALERQINVNTQIAINQEAQENARLQAGADAQARAKRLAARQDRECVALNGLKEGDQLPQISQLYDDAATIRMYLHDSGYVDLSDAQIQQVSAYMHAKGIKHISDLAQFEQVFKPTTIR